MKSYVDFLTEAAEGPRIPHPEDSIFAGSAEATKYVEALRSIIRNPSEITIKWDGMIALYFGKDEAGRFFIADKYMPAKNVYPKSSKDWVEYDRNRGANRNDLYQRIALIWSGLEQAVGSTPGTFKGDLMFAGSLEPVNNQFIFKPVTVEYHVPVNSDLGRLIAGRVGLVVVHQYNGSPWNGRGLASNTQVAVIPSNMGIRFTLKDPVKLSNDASIALAQTGTSVDQFLSGMPKVSQNALQTYLAHYKVRKTQLSLGDWLKDNVSGKQYKFLINDGTGYLVKNRRGLEGLFKIWNSISALKENLAQQLEPQVQGMQQFVNGQNQGEGFVIPSSIGLIKLVQRSEFGAAHFNGFAEKK